MVVLRAHDSERWFYKGIWDGRLQQRGQFLPMCSWLSFFLHLWMASCPKNQTLCMSGRPEDQELILVEGPQSITGENHG